MRKNVSELLKLVGDAKLSRQIVEDAEEARRRSAFQLYEFNTAPPLVLDQSPAARAAREIMRVVNWYGWGGEIERALDAAGVGSLSALTLDQVEQLRDHMQRLERCAQDGCDSPDALPAR